MLKLRKLLVMVLSGACLFLFPIFSNAQSATNEPPAGHEKMRNKMEGRFKEILDQLNLSKEQQDLLKKNKEQNKEQSKGLRDSVKSVMQELGDELKKKDLDMPKITALQTKLKDLRNQLADKRFEAILEVRKILTQEQFGKFIELTDKKMHMKDRD